MEPSGEALARIEAAWSQAGDLEAVDVATWVAWRDAALARVGLGFVGEAEALDAEFALESVVAVKGEAERRWALTWRYLRSPVARCALSELRFVSHVVDGVGGGGAEASFRTAGGAAWSGLVGALDARARPALTGAQLEGLGGVLRGAAGAVVVDLRDALAACNLQARGGFDEGPAAAMVASWAAAWRFGGFNVLAGVRTALAMRVPDIMASKRRHLAANEWLPPVDEPRCDWAVRRVSVGARAPHGG